MKEQADIKNINGKVLLEATADFNIELDEGVYRYLRPDFKLELDTYLSSFESFDHPGFLKIADPIKFEELPFIKNSPTWKTRADDLDFIQKHINPQSEVLEMGGGIGWLANRLSKDGHSVTSIDYFLGMHTGLKARNFYKDKNWISVNMDVKDIDQFKTKFDLLIFNRGITYYADIPGLIEKAKAMLKQWGKIIITGLNIYADDAKAMQHFDAIDKEFQDRFGRSLLIKPDSKKVLTDADKEMLEQMDFRMISADPLLKEWLKKDLFLDKNREYRAIYTARS